MIGQASRKAALAAAEVDRPMPDRAAQQCRVVGLAPALPPAAPGDLLLQRREQSGRRSGEDEVEAGERGELGRSQRLSGDDQVDVGGARLHGQTDQQGGGAPGSADSRRCSRHSRSLGSPGPSPGLVVGASRPAALVK